MNYLYFSKKLNLFSGYLNLFSSIGWIALILAIGYYHFHILNDPNSSQYYTSLPKASFIQNVFENLRQRTPITSVQLTSQFPAAYINANGYGAFFSGVVDILGNTAKYWTLIQPIFIFSIITSSSNILVSSICLFCSLKARKFSYIASSFVNLFIPIYGCILTMKIHNRWRLPRMLNQKKIKTVSPGQLVKFKTKLFLSKIFSDVTIPA